MTLLWNSIRETLIGNGLITAFLFSGIIVLLSNLIAEKVARRRIHASAIAIFLGLTAAYIGGAITGGEKGLSDIAVFGGLGLLGGATLRNFTIIASSYGAKISEIRKAGPAGFLSVFAGIFSSYLMGAIVALAFGYRDSVSISTIAAGLIKTVFIMVLTPFVARHVGVTTPKMAMIYGGLVGSTSGVSTGLAATNPDLVPYGTMVATFYSGFGCLLCPSLMYALTKLILPF